MNGSCFFDEKGMDYDNLAAESVKIRQKPQENFVKNHRNGLLNFP